MEFYIYMRLMNSYLNVSDSLWRIPFVSISNNYITALICICELNNVIMYTLLFTRSVSSLLCKYSEIMRYPCYKKVHGKMSARSQRFHMRL